MRRVVTASLCLTLSMTGHISLDARDLIARLSLDEAVSLAFPANPAVRAKEFERQATAANEITASLRANPVYQLEAALGGPLEN